MRRPSLILAAAIVVASTLTAGCISSGPAGTGHPSDARTIVVGVSGAFAENQLVAEMYAQVLEHAGYTVGREFDLRSREVSQSALESGQIDLKPEYMSSLLLFLDSKAQASSDPTDVARQVGERLRPEGHHGAHAIAGRGHESVRGEREDGAGIQPDHAELARRRRRPADDRLRRPSVRSDPSACRAFETSTGSSSRTSSRWTPEGRRPSPRSRATRCRSA